MLISYYRHELHTCLNAIIGYSELLREDAQSSGLTEVERGLGEIIIASQALLAFAKDFLSPNRLRELGHDALTTLTQKMYFASQEPMQKVVSTCATLIAAAEQASMYDLIPDLCKIQASGSMLQNLLDTHSSVLTLPAVGKPASEIHLPLELGSVAADSGKILIIDDNSMNRDLLRQWLERRGYSVDEASGGRQGLEYIQEQAYDLVMLDLRMPDLSGLDLLKELKEQGRLPGLPLVILSASEELGDVASCIEYGVLDYLVKPVNLAILNLRVRSYLERHRQQLFVQQLERKTQDVAAARPVSLPAAVAAELVPGSGAEAYLFPDVSVLYAEFRAASRLYNEHSAPAVIALLSRVSALCDALTTRYAVTRISSAVDACIAVAGLPMAQPEHATVIATLAGALLEEVAQFNTRHGLSLSLSLGVHSGPVLAGVFDKARPIYGIWGETCRIARRLCTVAADGEIYVSSETRQKLGATFRCEERPLLWTAGGEPWLAHRLQPGLQSR